MAINTYRIKGKDGRNESFFSLIEKFLRIDQSLNEVIHVKFLPQILFVSFLCLIYIGNRHYAEKKIRSISILDQQVNDLRADYTTLQADYMLESKQSEVAKKAERLGLIEPKRPPQKVALTE